MPKPTRSMKIVMKMTSSGERFMDYDLRSQIFGLLYLVSGFRCLDVTARQELQMSKEKAKDQKPKSFAFHYLHFPPDPLRPRSTESCPPPAINNARHMASSDSGYSIPAGAKKPPQCLPTIAANITHIRKNAATRVINSSKTSAPPTNSESGAAASQSQAGRIKLKGTGPEIHALNPLPPKLPNTFCAPCAMKTAASARRSGTVTQVEEVLMTLLNIYPPF